MDDGRSRYSSIRTPWITGEFNTTLTFSGTDRTLIVPLRMRIQLDQSDNKSSAVFDALCDSMMRGTATLAKYSTESAKQMKTSHTKYVWIMNIRNFRTINHDKCRTPNYPGQCFHINTSLTCSSESKVFSPLLAASSINTVQSISQYDLEGEQKLNSPVWKREELSVQSFLNRERYKGSSRD